MAADDKKGGKKGDGESPHKAAKADKAGKGDKGGKKGKRGEGAATSTPSTAPAVSATDAVSPRLLDKYKSEVIPALTKQFNYKNPMQVPRLRKIVVNMGLGAAVANPKTIATAVEELTAMSGQRPVGE